MCSGEQSRNSKDYTQRNRKDGAERDSKDDTERHGPEGFAEFCAHIMPSSVEGCCGSQMREMMSRFMARFQDARKDPGKAERTEA